VWRVSRELKILKTTVRKILWKKLQLYPYKLHLVQKLQPDDPFKRLACCEDLLSRMETDQGLSERVIFSDEATFFYPERSTGTTPGYGDPRILML